MPIGHLYIYIILTSMHCYANLIILHIYNAWTHYIFLSCKYLFIFFSGILCVFVCKSAHVCILIIYFETNICFEHVNFSNALLSNFGLYFFSYEASCTRSSMWKDRCQRLHQRMGDSHHSSPSAATTESSSSAMVPSTSSAHLPQEHYPSEEEDLNQSKEDAQPPQPGDHILVSIETRRYNLY